MTPPGVQLVAKPGRPTTGLGRYAAELERGLRAAGLAPRAAELRGVVPAPVARAARAVGFDLAAFGRSYPLRADLRPGYLTHLLSQTLGTLLLTQRPPRPTVVTVHDILPYLLRDDPDLRPHRHRLDRAMDALAMRGLRRADRLIAISDYTKRTLVEALGLPSDRIDVVHQGVDLARFRPGPVPDDFRARHRLPAGGAYLLYVGTEDPRKDLGTLLRALAELRRGGLDVTLLKVGAPAFAERRARHLRLADELGLAGAVRWFDEVPEDDLPRFYNAASVFAFPSRHEGFGFPVLEALACGTPVVARRAASIPEVAGDAARLVGSASDAESDDARPFAAALAEALAAGRTGAEAGVRWAARFTWAATVAGTRAVYARLAADGGGA